MVRKKTSLSLDEKIWNNFQSYSLTKYGNTRNANTELEIAMKEHMILHPLKKE